jgi:hypothetical protein
MNADHEHTKTPEVDIATLALRKRKAIDERLECVLEDVAALKRRYKRARKSAAPQKRHLGSRSKALDDIALMFSEVRKGPWFLVPGIDDLLINWLSTIFRREPLDDTAIDSDLVERIRDALVNVQPARIRVKMHTCLYPFGQDAQGEHFDVDSCSMEVVESDGSFRPTDWPSMLATERALGIYLNDTCNLVKGCKVERKSEGLFSKNTVYVDGIAVFLSS